MKCPKCSFEQSAQNTECLKCGIIFKKYLASLEADSEEVYEDEFYEDEFYTPLDTEDEGETSVLGIAKQLLFYVHPNVNPVIWGGRVILFLIIFIWGWVFIFSSIESLYVYRSFLHLINLPFHEAGHMIFRPFGKFIMVLGGSLMQLLIPLICLVTLVIKTRDTFGASVCLWWLGENFLDLAPYIGDARALKLMLIGGVTGRDVADYHDWDYILRHMGLLQYDLTLAALAKFVGVVLMLAAFVWGGYIIVRQFQNLDK